MRLYLVGVRTDPKLFGLFIKYNPFCLESFFKKPTGALLEWARQNPERFMLDSGVFSLLNANKLTVEISKYTDDYISFIKANNFKYFFEMDLDRFIGEEKVLELRERIEAGTGRKCIPVWHWSRGAEEWVNLCENYDLVAFGAFITDHIPINKLKPALPWFIRTANRNGTKVHGLGFCPRNFDKVGFWSVDCSTWNTWKTRVDVFTFNGHHVSRDPLISKYRVSADKINAHNFEEWCKLSRSLEEKP